MKKYFYIGFLLISCLTQADTIFSKSIFLKIDSAIQVGNYEFANQEYSKCINRYESNSKSSRFFDFKQKNAECLSRLGKIEEAETEINQCLSNKITQNTKIAAQNTKGYIELKKGRTDNAIDLFKEALNSCSETQKILSAECYNNLGIAYWTSGNYELAKEHLHKTLVIYQEKFGENSFKTASVYNNLGLILSSTEPQNALENYNKALLIYQKLFPNANHPALAIAYTNKGVIYKNKAENNLALDNFENALRINTAIYGENHPTVAFVKTNIAQVFLQRGSTAKAIDNLVAAQAIYQKTYGNKHPEIANIENILGNISLKDGKFKEALAHYQKALIANSASFENQDWKTNPQSQTAYNKMLMLNTLDQKAKTIDAYHFSKSLKKKELVQAAFIYRICDTLINSIRQSLIAKADKIALGAEASNVYEHAISVNLSLSDVSLSKQKYWEEAFYFNEKSKAAVLLESIADANAKQFSGVPDSLIQYEKNMQATISFISQQLAQKPDAKQEKTLRDKLFATNRLYEKFTQNLNQNYPEYYNLKFSQSITNSSELAKIMAKNVALCSFFVGEETQKIYCFYVNNKGLKVYAASISFEIEKQVTALRNGIKYNLPDTFNEFAFKLYKQLFPFKVSQSVDNLVIIPDGKLGTIPFESLLTKKYNSDSYINAPFLLQNISVSYAYSATLYRDANKTNVPYMSKMALICAPVMFYSKQNLLPLPATENECMDIRKLLMLNKFDTRTFVGKQAKESVMKTNKLTDYRYIHLATHGSVNENHPELSQIFLNPDSSATKEDGNLFSWEIYGLKLNAQMVTLSACQTGLGKVSKGEGIIGLSRALLFAGAQNVVVSLWTVSDASTSKLMVDFYQSLTSPNQTLTASLRKSKLELLKDPIYSNPYYWAPFILIGK